MPTVNDFFCGAGGMSIGFRNAGFKVMYAADVDKFAVQTYKANVGKNCFQEDIRELDYTEIPPAAVWSFGFPCQDLSVAGKQKGFCFRCKECGNEFSLYTDTDVKCPVCGSEEIQPTSRSGLFFEIMRLLDETQEHRAKWMPKILFAENVKGLKPYLQMLVTEFEKRGYTPHIQLFNSKYWGVPQHRERYFIVGIRNPDKPFTFPEEQHEYVPKLSSVLDSNVDEKYHISGEKAQTILSQAKEKHNPLGTVHATITPDRLIKRQNGPRCKPEEREMFTLTAQDIHGLICVGDLDIKGHNLTRRVYSPEGISPTLNTCQGGNRHSKILDNHSVRRLTPTEYGRLQAFPMDNWKQVVSDSQAYKQFGNAVTTTVVTAIAEKIKEYLKTLK